MRPDWKIVRVFISSTFRDMHAERDYLVRTVFPELRERCAKLRVHLIDVDLRWGVTEEEAQGGAVIETCLGEIDRCRPFFVGILGERYGWIPSRYAVPDQPGYDWLRDLEPGLSVTALEIYHGVLRSPTMRPRAFFYFRDPSFLPGLPENQRADFLAESPVAAERLRKLKDEIRAQCTVLDGYPCHVRGLDGHRRPALGGLELFGQRVLADLWKSIREEHSEARVESDPLALESAYHEAFLERSARHLVGRGDLLQRMAAYADGAEPAPLVVLGPPGCGKSALLAAFAHRYAMEHDQIAVLPHFIGVSPGSSDIRQTLRRVWTALHRILGRSREPPEDYEELRRALFEIVRRWPGSKVVLVLDGLNQLDETHRAHTLDWLPTTLPAGVRVVVSTLEGDCLDALRRRTPSPIQLQVSSLASEDRKDLVRRTLAEYRKRLDERAGRDQMAALLSKADSESPLYLSVACEELRLFGEFEQVDARIRQLPERTDELFGQVLERLETDHGSTLVEETLALLESSRHGLRENELLELLRDPAEPELPRAVWAQLYRSLQFYLKPAGEAGEGMLDFFHRQLARAVRRRYLLSDSARAVWHHRLAGYFRLKADPDGNGSWTGPDPRGFSELSYHLVEADELSEVRTLVSSGFLAAEAGVLGEGESLADARAMATAFARVGAEHREALVEAAWAHCRLSEGIRSIRKRFERLIEAGAIDQVRLVLESETNVIRRGAATLAAAALLEESGYEETGAELWAQGLTLLPGDLALVKGQGDLDAVARSLVLALLQTRLVRGSPAERALAGLSSRAGGGDFRPFGIDPPNARGAQRRAPARAPATAPAHPRSHVPFRDVALSYVASEPFALAWTFLTAAVFLVAGVGLFVSSRFIDWPLQQLHRGVLASLAFLSLGLTVVHLVGGILVLVLHHYQKFQRWAEARRDRTESVFRGLAEGARSARSEAARRRIVSRALRYRRALSVESPALASLVKVEWDRCETNPELARLVARASGAGPECADVVSDRLSTCGAAQIEAIYGELRLLPEGQRDPAQILRMLAENADRAMDPELLVQELFGHPDLELFQEADAGGRDRVSSAGIEKRFTRRDIARAVLAAVEGYRPTRRRRWFTNVRQLATSGIGEQLSPAEPLLWLLLFGPTLLLAPVALLVGAVLGGGALLLRALWCWEYDPFLLRRTLDHPETAATCLEAEGVLLQYGSGLGRRGGRRVGRAIVAHRILTEQRVRPDLYGRGTVAAVLKCLTRGNLLERSGELILAVMGDPTLLSMAARYLPRSRRPFARPASPADEPRLREQFRRTLPMRTVGAQLLISTITSSALVATWLLFADRLMPPAHELRRLHLLVPAAVGFALFAVVLQHLASGRYGKAWSELPHPAGASSTAGRMLRHLSRPISGLRDGLREPAGTPSPWRTLAKEKRGVSAAMKAILLLAAFFVLSAVLATDALLHGSGPRKLATAQSGVAALCVAVVGLLTVHIVGPEVIAAWRGSGLLYRGRIRRWLQRLAIVPVVLVVYYLLALLLQALG